MTVSCAACAVVDGVLVPEPPPQALKAPAATTRTAARRRVVKSHDPAVVLVARVVKENRGNGGWIFMGREYRYAIPDRISDCKQMLTHD